MLRFGTEDELLIQGQMAPETEGFLQRSRALLRAQQRPSAHSSPGSCSLTQVQAFWCQKSQEPSKPRVQIKDLRAHRGAAESLDERQRLLRELESCQGRVWADLHEMQISTINPP